MLKNAITDKQQSKLWIDEAMEHVVWLFECVADPFGGSLIDEIEIEVEQLVEKINHLLREIELDCVKRIRDDSGKEPGETLPLQHICRRCWHWIIVNTPRGARITCRLGFGDLELTLSNFPPEGIVCPSCGFVNHRCGRQRFCDPEGVVVDSDPFPNLPSLAAPRPIDTSWDIDI